MRYFLILILTFNVFALTDVVKVGLFDVAPFSYINGKGELDGVTFKFLKKLETESGLKFNFTILPYARLVDNLKDGNVDMGMFYPSSKNSGDFIKLSETLGNDNIIVLRSDISAKALSDLKGKIIARIRGGKYYDEFDNDDEIRKVDSVNYAQSATLFLARRVDGFIIPRVALRYLIHTNNYRKEDFSHSIFVNHKKNFLHIRNGLSEELKKKLEIANIEVIKKYKLKKLEDLL
ncbi:ABC transporter substrate-binding protein [Bacteriovorax sp. Seq25_V]|uniref:substrate-binding periplasmic protein n=1 Tax=Bacteriovorax sp. Seq25_V TaxID=1201288 RepID=UPI0012FCFFD1|nr:transporter substrate-binding domain-containing protein [Bacteriovorax sp. Seq25_V]